MDALVPRCLELLERCFHMVLRWGMESDAFRDYKEVQDLLHHLEPRVSAENARLIREQLERFDWDALNCEIRSRASAI